MTGMMTSIHSTMFAAFLIASQIFAAHGELASTVQSPTAENIDSSPSPRSYSFYDGNSHSNSNRDSSRNSHYSDRRQEVTSRPYTIASTSYSVQPSSSSSSSSGLGGSAVYIDAAPIPIKFTRNPATTERTGNYESLWRNQYRSRPAINNIRDKLMELDCQGAECDEDLNRSYYSVLNGKHDYPARFPARGETSVNKRYSEVGNEDGIYTRYASFPFNVRGNGPEEYDFPRRRVTRTSTSTTSSPSGWVQLSPRPSEKNTYDPFFAKGDDKDLEPGPKSHNEDKLSSSKFQNRLGVELNPDTFAARWGWGEKSGTRIPDWLQKLNEQYASLPDVAIRRPGPTRDEDPKNWVKLEPIPVSGVSISKWVPKGTTSSELPTTGNNVRNKPHGWWDNPASPVLTKKPSYGIKNNNMGWGSSNDYDSLYTKRPAKPGNAWQDIIYPETPGSATASWETTTDILKGSQRFPSMSGNGWKSETVRGPVASWTAPGGTNRNYHHRRPTNNYPDLQSGDDDQRWVLISNSRHSTPSKSSLSHQYRPHPNRWRLDLHDRDRHDMIDHDYEPNEGPSVSFQRRRVAKDYKVAEKTVQDEAFDRVNFTLQNLQPILSFDGTDQGRAFRSPLLNGTKLTTTTAKTTTTTTTKRPDNKQSVVKDVYVQPPRRKSFLSALIGDGRQATIQSATAPAVNGTKLVARKGNSMKPVLAAVGAGMIPAAMAAAIPMMLGRKKRSVKAEIIAVDHYPHHVQSIPRSLVNYASRPFNLERPQRTRL